MIEVTDLSRHVSIADRRLTLLQHINFSIATGEAVAIVGASGSGKSTLLGLLAGLDTPDEGRVMLDGEDISALDEDGRARLRGRLTGFVFRSFQLIPSLTAIENVMLPLELAERKDARAAAMKIIDRVGLAQRCDHYPRQLSGGEQQRVAIARAFVPQPKILFADEPTGNLDRATGELITELLFSLNAEQSATLVLVTHDEALAQRCHRSLKLDAGRLIDNP